MSCPCASASNRWDIIPLFSSSAADITIGLRFESLAIPNNRLSQFTCCGHLYWLSAAKRLCAPAFIGVHSGSITQLGERKRAWRKALATDLWLWLLNTCPGFWLNSCASVIRSAHIVPQDSSNA